MQILLIVLCILVVALGISLLILYTQIGRYARYWSNQATSTKPDDALTYVALGDSTAQAIGATVPQKGYVGLLAQSIEHQYDRPVHVINLSKSGATLQDCLKEQLPQLQYHQPDFITIEIGANNMVIFDETTFQRDMDTLMEKLPKKTAMSDIPYFGGGRFRAAEKNVVRANEIVDELAKKHGLSVAPLHELTQERDRIINYTIDLFHPSNAGYRNWHDAFWIQLKDQDLSR